MPLLIPFAARTASKTPNAFQWDNNPKFAHSQKTFDPRLKHGSFGPQSPHKSALQTASRLVQTFLHSRKVWRTYRQTHRHVWHLLQPAASMLLGHLAPDPPVCYRTAYSAPSRWLVEWLSGRTSVFSRRTFSVLCSTCSWRVTTYVGKPSAMGQPTRPTQPFIPSGSIDE